MPLNQALLAEFDNEMATTRKTLERVPEDKMGWKPHDKSMSLARLATHLATLNHWVESAMGLKKLDIGDVPGPADITSRQALLAEFDKNTAAARKAIAGATDEQLMKPWTLLFKGQTVFSMPRLGVLRGFVMNHIIHHRGQMTVYLRLNNVPVPSIYGPSADEGRM